MHILQTPNIYTIFRWINTPGAETENDLSRWARFLAWTYPIGSIFRHGPIPLGPILGMGLSHWAQFLAQTYPVGSIFKIRVEPLRGNFGRVPPPWGIHPCMCRDVFLSSRGGCENTHSWADNQKIMHFGLKALNFVGLLFYPKELILDMEPTPQSPLVAKIGTTKYGI